MSGGSWDYFCYKVAEAADRLEEEGCAYRRALGCHMRLVTKAMHDIEWVDSCDKSPGDELPAIKEVLGDSAKVAVLELLMEDARGLIKQLEMAVEAKV